MQIFFAAWKYHFSDAPTSKMQCSCQSAPASQCSPLASEAVEAASAALAVNKSTQTGLYNIQGCVIFNIIVHISKILLALLGLY